MANNEALMEQLESALATIAEMQALLEKLTAAPLSTAWVYQELAEYFAVVLKGELVLVEKPYELDVEPTDFVVLANSGQILDVLKTTIPFGEISVVREVLEKDSDTLAHAEVEVGGNITRVIYNPSRMELGRSDRVILDSSKSMVVVNMGKEKNRYGLDAESVISWNDIGGLEDAKRELIEAIELPMLHPELYAHYGHKAPKGFLFYGEPGCGKTLLGKAAAKAVQDISKANNDGVVEADGFMYIKGPEILEKWVGVAEQNIRAIFARATQFQEEHGFPAVVFIDEADALLGKRGSGVSSDMEKTIVPMFLSEMDGLNANGALVILATNRPDTLDPAVVREGRIDRKIHVTRPTQESAADIFEVHLRNKPLNGDVKELAKATAHSMYGAGLYEIEHKDETRTSTYFGLGDLASGAMIEGIVSRATQIALNNDLREQTRGEGLSMEHLAQAVEHVLEENRHIDYKPQVKEYVEPFKADVKSIRKVKA